MRKKTVKIITLGCRVNQYESCALAEALTKAGFSVNKKGDCDYYIINTCAVTAESQRKSKQIVRRCAAKGKTLVIGCAVQIDTSFSDIDNVIYVSGNHHKMSVVDAILQNNDYCISNICDIKDIKYEDMFISGETDLFSECRAFIKIQDGCNGKCTYCIIPQCRGKIRSRNPQYIYDECLRLVSSGYKEVILTGIEVSAYDKIQLHELIVNVSNIKGVERLRLGSLSPNKISEEFMENISKCHNFMPHIHMSIQSCCDKILNAMKRPYNKKMIFKTVELIRKYIPDCIISADIIVGFPGETEEDFMETCNALKDLNIFHVHSFPYSERDGTLAAEMPNSVPKSIRSQRNNRLIEAISVVKKNILDNYVNKTATILVEKIIDGYAVGHTANFIEAKCENRGYVVGDLVKTRIVNHNGNMLIGKNEE